MFSDNMPGFTPPTEQEKFEYFNNQIKKKDEKIKQLEAANKQLKDCLNDIQSQCVGEIAMGYKLDAEDLGRAIYEKTGIKQGNE